LLRLDIQKYFLCNPFTYFQQSSGCSVRRSRFEQGSSVSVDLPKELVGWVFFQVNGEFG
jgi:hypothetical protein